MPVKLPFFTLLLLISFASVNAVLFTPALPDIVHFFSISEDRVQLTISWFLIGYALGQLIYGPLANRFGRKPALYGGIGLQIISSLLCVLAGANHSFWLLVIARFLLALGSGVGLKMTFTLVNECFEPKRASQTISYLMLAFAITPGLGIALGGFLTTYWGWGSCFYASAIYGVLLLLLVTRLPETNKIADLNALKFKHLLSEYGVQLKNEQLIMGGLLMGCTTCFVYLFAAEAPFIAIDFFGMSSASYGVANCLPPIGLILGSLVNAKLIAKNYSLNTLIKSGVFIASLGVLIMFIAVSMNFSVLPTLFFPIIISYFGLALIMANASAIAMSSVVDKAHGSALMSFINMGLTTLVVLSLGLFPLKLILLPACYFVLCVAMIGITWLSKKNAVVLANG
jgi:MFS transporter, DHA1 family, multidrug resistance protein